MTKRSDLGFYALLGVTALTFAVLIAFVFLRVPDAQLPAGGVSQKSSTSTCLRRTRCTCAVRSVFSRVPSTWLAQRQRDAWAKAGAECACIFGSLVLTSGPLWAKKVGRVLDLGSATDDPAAHGLDLRRRVVLRAFGGAGEAERKFAAALTVLGTVTLPIVHIRCRSGAVITRP